MSIFILRNKNLKGKWRKILVSLYAVHLLLFLELIYLNKTKIASSETIGNLFLVWMIVAISICIAEYLFRRSVKNAIRS
jgi:hypothetical protein